MELSWSEVGVRRAKDMLRDVANDLPVASMTKEERGDFWDGFWALMDSEA